MIRVQDFEQAVAEYFGSPYAVATDSCTHGLELCLRLTREKYISSPRHTYVSVPMLADKLGLELIWYDDPWKDSYLISQDIRDAAVTWGRNTYHRGEFMCLSFQFQKHLSLGRGGMILLDDKYAKRELKKMSYDGRLPGIPWREQNIDCMGYHYYMTPETAKLGLSKLPEAIGREPRTWSSKDYPDVSNFSVFQ